MKRPAVNSLPLFAVILATTTGLSGCAAMMMQSPKSKDPSVVPRCSEGRGGVALDGIFTALYGALGIALLSEDEAGVALPFLALGTTHFISAYAGHGSANRCRKARKAHDEWAKGERLRQHEERQRRARVGRKDHACYPNRTCNQGLVCDQRRNRCVAEGAAPPAADEPAKNDPTAARAAAVQAARNAKAAAEQARRTRAQPAAPAKPPAGTAPTATAPRREPPPAPNTPPPPAQDDDIPWGDFWRESNL